eukprot:TRINITY_DN10163_c0_g1_i1.p1 TRINITY_DN10163_c0_g1~~TRINITY_DN10163_c0_g1_i1.p1  ORF type:complete len:287 (+),score=49.01 TRINITY_DN10163_c0_g1_i1:146-1006(+)
MFPVLRRVPQNAVRCMAVRSMSSLQRPIFFDMVHSNNAARIRLWMALKEGVQEQIDTKMITYPDLQSPDFIAVNPLKKVPGFIRQDGVTVFESAVILNYLEDKYSSASPAFKPATPEGRQLMDLIIRCHDLYVASPNITAPGFSHCQGAMYLSTGWHGAARGMDLQSRAYKIEEIWKQLSWLEENHVGPFLAGEDVSLADFTWFPTGVFMEFMLPRVFEWPDVFDVNVSPFPKLAAWYTKMKQNPAFAQVHEDIWGYWVKMEKEGQFKPILEELKNAPSDLKFKYP